MKTSTASSIFFLFIGLAILPLALPAEAAQKVAVETEAAEEQIAEEEQSTAELEELRTTLTKRSAVPARTAPNSSMRTWLGVVIVSLAVSLGVGFYQRHAEALQTEKVLAEAVKALPKSSDRFSKRALAGGAALAALLAAIGAYYGLRSRD